MTAIRATTVYLVRHGSVVGAETRRFIGHLDVALSDDGEEQAAAVAARLQGSELRAVYTSDLARARRTGEIIAAATGLVPITVAALREMAMGRWDGLTAEQIRSEEPTAFADWMSRVGEFPFPDGESVPDLARRVWPAFETIVREHEHERIAVVAHGGTNRAILCRALGLPLARLLSLGQHYGGVSILQRVDTRWALVALNELPLPTLADRPEASR